MEHQGENFGFYINDDADPSMQVQMRVMALHEEHKDLIDRLIESTTEDKDVDFSPEETSTLIGALDTTIKDVETLYTGALEKDPENVEVDDFVEIQMNLNGMRMELMKAQALQKKAEAS